MIKHIAFTVYPVKDMARARAFYENDLGLKLSSEYKGKWIEYHLNDNCFAITTMVGEVEEPSAKAGGAIGFEVDDVKATVDRLKAKGVKMKLEPFETAGCYMAMIYDPEGNGVILHQQKPR
jgi:predicted enzyme related to lactoylglutathione lyase